MKEIRSRVGELGAAPSTFDVDAPLDYLAGVVAELSQRQQISERLAFAAAALFQNLLLDAQSQGHSPQSAGCALADFIKDSA